MLKFYSSLYLPKTKFSRIVSFLLLALISIFILASLYAIYFLLKVTFSESIVLGFLFLFFVLPLMLRILFFIFFSMASSLITAFFFKGTNPHKTSKAKDEVIDVKYKILDK